VSRLRRESRDARKNRYSASKEVLSTKSITIDVKRINFFCNLQKNRIATHRERVFAAVSAMEFSRRVANDVAQHRIPDGVGDDSWRFLILKKEDVDACLRRHDGEVDAWDAARDGLYKLSDTRVAFN
jgi:hypothetical protein